MLIIQSSQDEEEKSREDRHAIRFTLPSGSFWRFRRTPIKSFSRCVAGRSTANETVEKPQNAQIFVRKVLCFQYLFFQVQTFSTVSITGRKTGSGLAVTQREMCKKNKMKKFYA